jgi:hypothetical protein
LIQTTTCLRDKRVIPEVILEKLDELEFLSDVGQRKSVYSPREGVPSVRKSPLRFCEQRRRRSTHPSLTINIEACSNNGGSG